jgi:regulator of protease activity HflC (stomatin/prohibitin superfamily)
MFTILDWSGLLISAAAILLLIRAIRIFREYERGVVFTLGRFWHVRDLGWYWSCQVFSK